MSMDANSVGAAQPDDLVTLMGHIGVSNVCLCSASA